MRRLKVRHVTTYRYAAPVSFGDHRLMVRPRDSHDLRLMDATLVIAPAPAGVRWLHDVFGNSVAVAHFAPEVTADTLRFESTLTLEHFIAVQPEFAIEDYARTYPFGYAADEVPDLARSIERHYPDPNHAVDLWAKAFVRTDGPTDTAEMLAAMARTIHDEFTYQARDLEGVQAPTETLSLRSGSCRDFALLMMEAARSLGFAARFVSGYLFVPAQGGNTGGGATHAWVQIYLPGAGWVEFDPTNSIIGNRDLIRVAVTRDPAQAQPLSGSFVGSAGSFLGMEVDVTVTEEAAPEQAAA